MQWADPLELDGTVAGWDVAVHGCTHVLVDQQAGPLGPVGSSGDAICCAVSGMSAIGDRAWEGGRATARERGIEEARASQRRRGRGRGRGRERGRVCVCVRAFVCVCVCARARVCVCEFVRVMLCLHVR